MKYTYIKVQTRNLECPTTKYVDTSTKTVGVKILNTIKLPSEIELKKLPKSIRLHDLRNNLCK